MLGTASELDGQVKKIISEHGVEKAGLIVKNQFHQTVMKLTLGDFQFDEVIPIASSSKWVTAAISLRILEKHNISLDQKTFSYLPKKIQKKAVPEFKKLSFRDLLSFQSRMTGFYACTFSAFPWMNTKKCSERILTGVSFQEKPGFEYNNLHMTILGYTLENIEGKKWNEIFQDEFKKFYGLKNKKIQYYAKPKQARGEKNPLIAGGLHISTHQYLDFLRTLMQKGTFKRKPFIRQESIVEMHRDHFPSHDFKVYKTPYESTGSNPHYALGNWAEGKGINSSGGTFGFYPWIDSENKYYAIYATEGKLREAQRSYKIVQKIRPLILQSLGSTSRNSK